MRWTERDQLNDIHDLFQKYNKTFFDGLIPAPHVRLSTRMTQTAGRVVYASWDLAISIPYHNHYGWGDELQDTVKHEMVHLYLKTINRPPWHTVEFKVICRVIGASFGAKPMPAPDRYEWQCPCCGLVISTRRRISRSACVACCEQYNSGKYTAKFNFILLRDLSNAEQLTLFGA